MVGNVSVGTKEARRGGQMLARLVCCGRKRERALLPLAKSLPHAQAGESRGHSRTCPRCSRTAKASPGRELVPPLPPTHTEVPGAGSHVRSAMAPGTSHGGRRNQDIARALSLSWRLGFNSSNHTESGWKGWLGLFLVFKVTPNDHGNTAWVFANGQRNSLGLQYLQDCLQQGRLCW